MCGFIGNSVTTGTVDLEALARASACLRERGPDDSTFLLVDVHDRTHLVVGTDPRATGVEHVRLAIAFRRLAIRGLGVGGRQPLTKDGRTWMVCNGQIYNDRELASAAGFAPHACDVVNLMELWSRAGPEILTRVVGMFGLAVVDLDARELLLARDPFGIKPVYVRDMGPDEGLSFGSDPRALLVLAHSQPRLDLDSAREFLHRGRTDIDLRSFVRSIRQLGPGSRVSFALDGARAPTTELIWSAKGPACRTITRDEAAAHVREAIFDSVAKHLRADVPVGAGLSGGVDSSIIVAVAHQLDPSSRLATFSYHADLPERSDAPWIAAMEDRIPVAAHHFGVEPNQLDAELEVMLDRVSDPVESPAVFAQFRLFRTARDAGVTVVLNGQGADELFAGYTAVLATRVAELAGEHRWAEARDLLRAAEDIHGRRRDDTLARATAMATNPDELRANLGAAGASPHAVEHGPSLLAQRQAFLSTGLPSLLRCEDRNSMASSIESRVPFLTAPLAEVALSLPSDSLVGSDGAMKLVLRRAFADILPAAIVERRAKIGFASPSRRWLEALLPWVTAVAHRSSAHVPPKLQTYLRSTCDLAQAKFDHDPEAVAREFTAALWRPATLAWWLDHHRVDPGELDQLVEPSNIV